MASFQRLINRLHNVFRKEPPLVDVIRIEYTGQDATIFVTRSMIRLLTTEGVLDIPTQNKTLVDVATSINDSRLATATLLNPEFNSLFAGGLLADTIPVGTSCRLKYPQSILWSEIQTYGYIQDEQWDRIAAAEQELYLHTADGAWQDYWIKDHFGIRRINNETDGEYWLRAKEEILAPKLNNRALETLCKKMSGVTVEIVDLGKQWCFIPNEMSSIMNGTRKLLYKYNGRMMKDNAFGVLVHARDISALTDKTKALIRRACEKYKAAGTAPYYFIPAYILHTNIEAHTANNKRYVLGPRPAEWLAVQF